MSKIRVGVVFGGRSGEHEVSLVSAQSVMSALDADKYEVVPIGISRRGEWLTGSDPLRLLQSVAQREGRLLSLGASSPAPASSETAGTGSRALAAVRTPYQALRARDGAVDVVFPVLHGPYGEDGTIQGLLEMADIPYVGAGVLGSALGMDKALQKTVLRAAGLPVVDWVDFTRKQWRDQREAILDLIERQLGYPCFTKPANLGSSVGIAKVRDRRELAAGLDDAARHDRKLMVERAAVNSREIECSVLGNDEPIASVPGEIRPRREFYDYAAKYVTSDTDLFIPADLPTATAERVRELAVAAFRAIDCAGMARVDFFVARDSDLIYVNELNTIPGFTAISMYPKLWQASGLTYSQLLDRLIVLALERHRDKSDDAETRQ